MKKISLILLIITFYNCNLSTTTENLENSKISMSYPTGWKIVLEDKIGSDGYYLEIEKSAVSET